MNANDFSKLDAQNGVDKSVQFSPEEMAAWRSLAENEIETGNEYVFSRDLPNEASWSQ